MECPHCRRVLAHQTADGGEILKTRYVRRTSDGKVVIACVRCGTELQQLRGKLVLYVSNSKKASADAPPKSSADTSDGD